MLLKKILIFSLLLTSNTKVFSQINDIELESLDDLSILEDFEKGGEDEIAQEDDENDEDLEEKDEDEVVESIGSPLQQDPLPDSLDGNFALDDSFLEDDFGDEFKEKGGNEVNTENKEELAALLEGETEDMGSIISENELVESDLKNIIPFDEVDLSEQKTSLDELQDTNQEINKDIINEFAKIKESKIDELIEEVKQNNKSRFSNKELKILKVQLSEIAKSPIKVFQVQRGTKLIRISDNKVLYTPKSLTVRAHVLTDHYKNKYIINKKGNLLYKVHFREISDIARVTNLYRAPQKFIRLEKKIKKNIYDENFDYSLKFKMHAGVNSAEYTKSLLSDPTGIAPMLRTEVTVLTNKKFFFESGMTFMYESVAGRFKSNGKYSISSFSFGPSFKSKPLLWDLGLVIQPRLAAFSRVNYTKNNISNGIDLSETSLLIGLEKEKIYKGYGHYLYGVNFQRKWIKANAKTVFLDVGNHLSHDDSFAFYVGHRSDWIW
jgi:hypothetical protein